jgi:hypothetical protein
MLAHERLDAEMDPVMTGGYDQALKRGRRGLGPQGFSSERCR